MAISPADAAHLLRRSGFGVRPERLAELIELPDRDAAVDLVTDLTAVPAAGMPIPAITSPNWVGDYTNMTNWWLDRMATTPVPIVEKLTLFWHGHFVTAVDKVMSMHHLALQNQTMRTHAVGDFHALAQAMAKDTAMMMYLDNWLNHRLLAQENFGRELMELFTLGPTEYSQEDVVAMAKAWTGHSVHTTAPYPYLYRADWHDNTNKKLFGTTAKNWDGPAALTEIIKGSKAEASSRFIAAKLFSFFAYPVTAADPVVVPLAEAFRSSNWSVIELVRVIFKSDAFWSSDARKALVRSPIELFVATLQATGLTAAESGVLYFTQASGQQPFNAPNVAGWGQNEFWLSTAASWGRSGFAAHVRWVARNKNVLVDTIYAKTADAVQQAFDQFGIVDPSPVTRRALEDYVDQARAQRANWLVQPNLILLTLLSPDFQVA